MAKKHCRKFQPAEYGAPTLQTDRRQKTDEIAIAYSELELDSSRSLKIAIIGYPSWDDFRIIFRGMLMDGQGTKRRRKLPKISTG